MRVDDLARDEVDRDGAGPRRADPFRVEGRAEAGGEVELRCAGPRRSLGGAPGERGRDEREDEAPDQRRVIVIVRLPQLSACFRVGNHRSIRKPFIAVPVSAATPGP